MRLLSIVSCLCTGDNTFVSSGSATDANALFFLLFLFFLSFLFFPSFHPDPSDTVQGCLRVGCGARQSGLVSAFAKRLSLRTLTTMLMLSQPLPQPLVSSARQKSQAASQIWMGVMPCMSLVRTNSTAS